MLLVVLYILLLIYFTDNVLLQHPPESVPDLLATLQTPSTEFVIGTRYGKGVEVDPNWPFYRVVISYVARVMGSLLTPLSDPMTGFFGLRKDVFRRGKNINPVGFKICLELFVKCGCKNVKEVPFSFGTRSFGESKLSGKVIVNYITQLLELYQYKFPGLLTILSLALFLVIVLLFNHFSS